MLPPSIELPTQIPVMALAGCNLLPHGLLPLYIFEPRYRQMLADALETDRMFAIGTIDPATAHLTENGQEPVFPASCAGMVRACVGAKNGTSHLVLQGLQRIRFTSWLENDKPYRVAEIEPISTIDENGDASAALAQRAVELARELINTGSADTSSQAMAEIEALDDPEPLADLIAYHLIRDPDRRQALLGMEELGERLRYLIAELANTGPSLP